MPKKELIKAVDMMIDDIKSGKYEGSMTGLQKLSPMELSYLRRNLITRLGLGNGKKPVTSRKSF